MNPFSLSSFLAASEPLQGLARHLIEDGGMHEPFLDALTEGDVQVIRFEVGQFYYVETLTKYYVGRCKEVTPTELVLDEAAWVDDTGRLSAFLKNGWDNPSVAAEPYPDDVSIPAHMISSVTVWNHKKLTRVI